MHLVSEEVQLEFNKRTPYNYLQVAYFKVKQKFGKVCKMPGMAAE